jgi:hypothetical protein
VVRIETKFRLDRTAGIHKFVIAEVERFAADAKNGFGLQVVPSAASSMTRRYLSVLTRFFGTSGRK